MKTDDELINSIIVNPANFDHISKTGKINGTLYTELKRVIKEVESRITQKNESVIPPVSKSVCSCTEHPRPLIILEGKIFCTRCDLFIEQTVC